MTTQNNAARAATKEIREAFELSYAMNADDPASATEPSHFTNGWRACIMSQVRAHVADERALPPMPPMQDREPHDIAGYVDSDDEWARSNPGAVEWLADNHAAIRAALASAPVAKPRRAPLDDWRVQAIADCLETEWDDMSPDLAESYARTIVGHLIEYEKESDRIEAQHAAEPVHPVVQAVRNLRASAPVAGEAQSEAKYERMFIAACEALAAINEKLGLDPNDGEPDAILSAIGDLMGQPNAAAPQARNTERIIFPAHLRKMWSGGEVQAWLDEHQGITPPKASAKGSMERYRAWQAEQAEAKADGSPCSCPSGDGSLRHPCAKHPQAPHHE